MRVLIAALLLLCALFVPGVAAESESSECTNKGDVRFCFEDYGCDSSGICRHHTYCAYLLEWRNCTYT